MNQIHEYIGTRNKGRNLSPHDMAVIAVIAESTIDLITNHYSEVEHIQKATEKTVSIAMSFKIGWEGTEAIVKSNIGFSRSWKDGREDRVEDPRQTKLFEQTRATIAAETPAPEQPKAKGKRPPKNKPLSAPIGDQLETSKIKGNK